jgi:hypothetical protein
MVFTGRGGIDINMPLTSKYEGTAFHEFKIGTPFIVHYTYLVPAVRIDAHRGLTAEPFESPLLLTSKP